VARVGEILANRERVAEEATERAIKRTALSREAVIQMLIDDRALARQNNQAAAAIKAAELIGKELFRMFIERREHGRPGEFDGLGRNELEQQIVNELVSGGITEQAARAFVRARSA
jgi:hypothetical protein